MLEFDGNTIRLLSLSNGFPVNVAGAGEQSLWCMAVAGAAGNPEAALRFMEKFKEDL